MNVKEFKEWLEQFPDDTVVEVIETIDRGYDGTVVTIRDFTGEKFDDYEFIDYKGKRSITFGKEG